MFAGEHKLDNLILILDKNRISMLDYCDKIMDLEPYGTKFESFKWEVKTVDGHDINHVYNSLIALKNERNNKPKLLIANTIKGKGVPGLENDSLCHIKSLKPQEIDKLLEGFE